MSGLCRRRSREARAAATVACMIALLFALLAPQAHSEILVGRDERGALAVAFQGAQPFPLAASRFVGVDGYADGVPGLLSVTEPLPGVPLLGLDPAASIVLVLVGADEGIGVWNDRGTALMRPGDTYRVGPPFFDSHPVWQLPAGQPGKTYALRLQVRDTNGRHADSEVFAATFAPDDATMLYACPMRCPGARIASTPAMCDVCGMHLKLFSAKSYRVSVAPPSGDELRAGRETELAFRLATPEGEPVRDLEVVHEKLLHLLMVSSDLSWFAHEHPELRPDGELRLPFTFPHGGTFTLFHDFTPRRAGMQVVPVELQVAGDAPPPAALELTPRTVSVDGYTATLETPVPLRSIRTLELAVSLARAGQPVTDLEPFLGALGHLIVVRADRQQFVHSHPLPAPAGQAAAAGPRVVFSAQFAAPGRYKAWAQFQHEGRVLTVPFVFDVASPFDAQPPPSGG